MDWSSIALIVHRDQMATIPALVAAADLEVRPSLEGGLAGSRNLAPPIINRRTFAGQIRSPPSRAPIAEVAQLYCSAEVGVAAAGRTCCNGKLGVLWCAGDAGEHQGEPAHVAV